MIQNHSRRAQGGRRSWGRIGIGNYCPRPEDGKRGGGSAHATHGTATDDRRLGTDGYCYRAFTTSPPKTRKLKGDRICGFSHLALSGREGTEGLLRCMVTAKKLLEGNETGLSGKLLLQAAAREGAFRRKSLKGEHRKTCNNR